MALTKWTPETNPMILRRVGKTGEELAEAAKVCSRIVIQGIDGIDPATKESNRDALSKEIADVLAQCQVTIRALELDPGPIIARTDAKVAQMAEWEAMFEPPHQGQPWTPQPGELVRYADGKTALALHGEPHAGGWHGAQCMGGTAFYTRAYQPTDADRATWVECAVKWRSKTLGQAMAEAGLTTAKVPT